MKLRQAVLSPAFWLLALASSASATTCKRLTDSDSPFTAAFALWGNMTEAEVAETFTPLDTSAPWMSKCLASMNPVTLYSSVATSSTFVSCSKSVTSFAMPDQLNDATIRDTICPFYKDTLVPCVNSVLVQTFVDAMTASGGCCDDMKTQISTLFGADIKTMASQMLHRVGDVVCSVKTITNSAGKTTTQSCGESLAAGLLSDDVFSNLLTFFQLPNNQACKAMSGASFTTSTGSTAQFKWSTQGLESIGICYEPVSDFFKMLADYPMMSSATKYADGAKSFTMSDLFSSSTCLQSSTVFEYLVDKNSAPMALLGAIDEAKATMSSGSAPGNLTDSVAAMIDYAKGGMPSMCFHVATGQSCDYGSAKIASAFSTTTSSQKSTASASLLSSVSVLLLLLASWIQA